MEIIYFLIGVSIIAAIFLVYGLYMNWQDSHRAIGV